MKAVGNSPDWSCWFKFCSHVFLLKESKSKNSRIFHWTTETCRNFNLDPLGLNYQRGQLQVLAMLLPKMENYLPVQEPEHLCQAMFVFKVLKRVAPFHVSDHSSQTSEVTIMLEVTWMRFILHYSASPKFNPVPIWGFLLLGYPVTRENIGNWSTSDYLVLQPMGIGGIGFG